MKAQASETFPEVNIDVEGLLGFDHLSRLTSAAESRREGLSRLVETGRLFSKVGIDEAPRDDVPLEVPFDESEISGSGD